MSNIIYNPLDLYNFSITENQSILLLYPVNVLSDDILHTYFYLETNSFEDNFLYSINCGISSINLFNTISHRFSPSLIMDNNRHKLLLIKGNNILKISD